MASLVLSSDTFFFFGGGGRSWEKSNQFQLKQLQKDFKPGYAIMLSRQKGSF